MQVSVTSPSKVEKCLTIIVPAVRIEREYDKHLAIFAKKADIKGFRPGKVPLTYVKQRFAQEVRGEAINDVIQKTFDEAVHQEKLQPISAPRVEIKSGSPGDALEYTATFDVFPEMGDIHFKLDRLKKSVAKVTDQDVERAIERLRGQHVVWKKVDRSAQKADKINSTIYISQETGEALFENGVPLEFVLEDKPSIFGWNLVEQLQGMAAGEEKKFSYTLPQEAFLKGMEGKTLEFRIETREVLEPQLPELDDAFVKKMGIVSGEVSALVAEIRTQMEINLKRSIKGLLKEQVFDKLIEQNILEIPASLIKREAKHIHDDSCSMKGQDAHHHSEEDEAYITTVAKKRIQLGLLVNEITSKNKIIPSTEMIDKYLADLASVYSDADTYIKQIKADKKKFKEIETLVLEDLIVEKLLENVSVVEKDISYEQLIKQS